MRLWLLTLLLLPTLARAEPLSFGVFGDLPYSARERAELPRMVSAMDGEDLAFVIHDGDIKSGGDPCSDEMLEDRLRLFETSAHPLIYIPGDNEWTDCHRASNGGYDPLERLSRLRQMFFAEPTLGGGKMPVIRQTPDYPENVRWQANGFQFVGLNVPGSNNNWGSRSTPSEEYRKRSQANRLWLAKSFAEAREGALKGLILVIQANPGFEGDRDAAKRPDGYRELIDQLRAETNRYPGSVVLIHGDTHYHRIDQPLTDPASGRLIDNFTRLETYGSPFMGWVKVTIDPEAEPPVRFESHPWLPLPSNDTHP